MAGPAYILTSSLAGLLSVTPTAVAPVFLMTVILPWVLVVLITFPALPPGLSPNYCFFIFYGFSFFYSSGSALCQRQTYVSIFLLRKLLEPKFSFIQQPVLTSFSGENNSHASVDVSIHLNCSQPKIPPGHTWHALVKVCKQQSSFWPSNLVFSGLQGLEIPSSFNVEIMSFLLGKDFCLSVHLAYLWWSSLTYSEQSLLASP